MSNTLSPTKQQLEGKSGADPTHSSTALEFLLSLHLSKPLGLLLVLGFSLIGIGRAESKGPGWLGLTAYQI